MIKQLKHSLREGTTLIKIQTTVNQWTQSNGQWQNLVRTNKYWKQAGIILNLLYVSELNFLSSENFLCLIRENYFFSWSNFKRFIIHNYNLSFFIIFYHDFYFNKKFLYLELNYLILIECKTNLEKLQSNVQASSHLFILK